MSYRHLTECLGHSISIYEVDKDGIEKIIDLEETRKKAEDLKK
ncbi:MAG: hypothetical protein ABIB79_02300 [archaeon]